MAWWSIFTPRTAQTSIETVKSIADGIIDGLDDRKLTDQERIEFDIERSKLWLQIQGVLANENSQQSMARRHLATLIIGFFLLDLAAAAVTFPFAPDFAAFLLGLVSETHLGVLVTGVGFIYFGPHQLSKLKALKKESK